MGITKDGLVKSLRTWLSDFRQAARLYTIAGNFKKDALGRDIYYPNGPAAQGYIVPNLAEYKSLHIWNTKLVHSSALLLPLVFLNIWVYAFLCIFIFLWSYLVVHNAIKRLEKSDEKLTFKEYWAALIPSISLSGLIFSECCFLYFLISEIMNAGDGTGDLLFGGIGSSILGIFIWMKIHYLRVSNTFPKTWKDCFLYGVQILVMVSLLAAGLIVWAYLMIAAAKLGGY